MSTFSAVVSQAEAVRQRDAGEYVLFVGALQARAVARAARVLPASPRGSFCAP